jgi:outer membrane protein, heavy metal efflux system
MPPIVMSIARAWRVPSTCRDLDPARETPMRYRSLILGLTLASLPLVCIPALAMSDEPPGATVRSVHQWLQANNPLLSALALDAAAAVESVDAAAALPDPSIGVELRDISIDRPRLLPGQVGSTRYQLRQRFPLWGKRELARSQARAQADAAFGQRDATALDLLAQADRAYVRYWQARESIQVLVRILARLSDLQELARTRYAAGLAPQQDALQAAVEITRMRGEQISRQAQRQSAAAMLNAALGRDPAAPLADPAAPPELPVPEELDQVLISAGTSHPLVQTQSALAAASADQSELTRRERYPDLMVGLGLIQDGDRLRAWELMFEVQIPLQQGALHRRERAASLRHAAAVARRDAALNELRGSAAAAHARWHGAREQRQLIEEVLLIEAETAYASAVSSYAASAVDFGTLLQALRQTLAADLDRVDAITTELLAAADVRALTGEQP